MVDAGLAFPRDEHLGVDLILPDFGYLHDRDVLAVVLTHAHEDHVGALPYLLREIRVRGDLGDAADARARQVEARRARPAARRGAAARSSRTAAPLELGPFRLEFVRMSHSVPDAVGICDRDARPGACSTRATGSSTTRRSTGCAPTSASSPSSATAASTCCSATRRTPSGPASRGPSASSARRSARSSRPRQGRVLISSLRLEHPPDAAGDRRRRRGRPHGQRGRPLDAQEPEHRAQPRLHRGARGVPRPAAATSTSCRRERQLILCTGSQGEPLSALTRIAYNDHPAVKVERGDTVIISARPVPGNELRVHDSINRLTRSGAEVLHEENAAVHVSGHARSEELRTLLGARAPEGGDADPRRVPHAGGARAARAGRRRARVVDRDRRERRRRRALEDGRPDRRPRRGRA